MSREVTRREGVFARKRPDPLLGCVLRIGWSQLEADRIRPQSDVAERALISHSATFPVPTPQAFRPHLIRVTIEDAASASSLNLNVEPPRDTSAPLLRYVREQARSSPDLFVRKG